MIDVDAPPPQPPTYIPLRAQRSLRVDRTRDGHRVIDLQDIFIARAYTVRPHSLMGSSHPFNQITEEGEANGYEPSARDRRWGLALRAGLGVCLLAVPSLVIYLSWRFYHRGKEGS